MIKVLLKNAFANKEVNQQHNLFMGIQHAEVLGIFKCCSQFIYNDLPIHILKEYMKLMGPAYIPPERPKEHKVYPNLKAFVQQAFGKVILRSITITHTTIKPCIAKYLSESNLVQVVNGEGEVICKATYIAGTEATKFPSKVNISFILCTNYITCRLLGKAKYAISCFQQCS
eukprot:TRINITY_DN92020_c0_g1_i1.p2 TRINITY_DN92020_c0_g1~~TRINITY_DN92020_c0_g1_i1.p2  ORF type:complete len:172 (-),score=8.96 TRINITY_DN92020_c0_g1_i1:187-702(-)